MDKKKAAENSGLEIDVDSEQSHINVRKLSGGEAGNGAPRKQRCWVKYIDRSDRNTDRWRRKTVTASVTVVVRPQETRAKKTPHVICGARC